LAQKDCESPRLDADVLLAHVLECKRIDLYGVRHEEIATDDVRKRYRELIRQRLEGCPVAYLVGRKEFFSLELEVTRDVLIPRPDSEMVVLECLKLAKTTPAARILDIGTGSGNLAIALAKNIPAADVTTIDISQKALDVAGRNAARHGLSERVRFLQGDLFAPIPAGETFDVIVSNPPYIPHGEIAELAPGVRDYEPHLALDGGPDGYAVFDRILRDAPRYLKEGDTLILEIGTEQEQPARQRIEAAGVFQLAPTVFDFSRHPRVLRARYQP
jgi:release factor glutamine methyltransferase